jgi:predicted N-acetyltransferase YhbS
MNYHSKEKMYMTESSLIVRALETPEEYHLQLTLSDREFSSQPSPEGVERWQRFLTGLPDFRPELLRGAFLDDQQVGGYMLYEREMRMGAARIPTGGIGIVVARPEYRKRGIATALMNDAIQFAHDHKYALLLLDGIPKFYYRYGYTDMFDLTDVEVDRAAILAEKSSAYTVRTITVDDAAAALRLYEHQYGHYTGSFVRTLEQQAYRLGSRSAEDVVAVAPNGEVQGYLSGFDGNVAHEVAADNWEALLALMQYHAYMFKDDDATTTLRYRLPRHDRLVQWMLDHLEVPDTSHWRHPADEWVLRGGSYHHRYAGWMGRIVHFPTLMQTMLPELQRRWQHGLAQWNGRVVLSIGGELCVLHIDGRRIELGDPLHVASGVEAIQLTPQIFTQLIFGYRSAEQALEACSQNVPDELLSVLSILFPPDHTWIARSDWI